MGIDPANVTDALLRRMNPEGRELMARKRGHRNGGLSSQEARAQADARLERDEQRILAGLLKIKEDAGILVFDWSATNRRVTCRTGMPDFKIYRDGRVLFGEMKADGGRLSPDQVERHHQFLRSGTEVQIWHSADQGYRLILNWLWTHWRIWDERIESTFPSLV
jgi:hypothetical protein